MLLVRDVLLGYLIARHEALPLLPAAMLRRDERTMAWEYDGFIFVKRLKCLKVKLFGKT
jgi:hypothetical protein